MSSEIVPETSPKPTDGLQVEPVPVDSKLRRLARRAKNKFDSAPQGWGQIRSEKDSSEPSAVDDDVVEDDSSTPSGKEEVSE